MPLDDLFQASSPVIPIRAVHLDLKGLPPTLSRLLDLLHLFAAARYNAVLVEWEDAFPWTVDERFRSPTAYSPADVQRVAASAAELGLEIIPLVQCLGHLETPLSLAGYEHLREVPDRPDVLNPLAPGARELIEKMVDDVLALLPGVRRFHFGGDEAWTFGTHPDTRAYIAQYGKGALYLHHVEPILARLNARGIRPLLWHDMMRDWEPAALRALAAQADLMVWGYQGHPDTTSHHFSSQIIARFREHDIPLWGATAYKGADGHNIDLPDWPARQANALAWAEVAQREHMQGVVATAWSRYSTHRVQNEPIDAALDALVATAVILHDGAAPAGGIAACGSAVAALPEGRRFPACQAALRALADLRRQGWRAVQDLREQLCLEARDPGRRGQRALSASAAARRALQDVLQRADAITTDVRRALDQFVDPLWVEEYLAERLDPFREELAIFPGHPQ